jgi:hypothetical protein
VRLDRELLDHDRACRQRPDSGIAVGDGRAFGQHQEAALERAVAPQRRAHVERDEARLGQPAERVGEAGGRHERRAIERSGSETLGRVAQLAQAVRRRARVAVVSGGEDDGRAAALARLDMGRDRLAAGVDCQRRLAGMRLAAAIERRPERLKPLAVEPLHVHARADLARGRLAECREQRAVRRMGERAVARVAAVREAEVVR